MAVVTMARSAYGLDVGADDGWWHRAACQETPDLFTEIAPGIAGAEQSCRAAHICANHCPVLEQCTRDAMGNRPASVVQGGLLWFAFTSKEPKQPTDPGCGPWCIHLRFRRPW